MAVVTGPIRVTKLDSDGCPTDETVEVDAFDLMISEDPVEVDQEPINMDSLKEAHFTMELCWKPGGKQEFIEVVAGVDFWKKLERMRRRSAWRARKTKKRQR